MCLKKITAFALALAFTLQVPIAFATENIVSSLTYISSDNTNNPNTVNNNKTQIKVGEAIKSDDSLNFSIRAKDNNLINFKLDDIRNVTTKKIKELNSNPELSYKDEVLKSLYDEILLICDFYENINPEEYDDFRWAVLFNITKYILIDYEDLNNSPKKDVSFEEAQVLANKLLDIKSYTVEDDDGKTVDISENDFKILFDRLYLNLEKSIESQDFDFINITTFTVDESQENTDNAIEDNNNGVYQSEIVEEPITPEDISQTIENPTENTHLNEQSPPNTITNNEIVLEDEEGSLVSVNIVKPVNPYELGGSPKIESNHTQAWDSDNDYSDGNLASTNNYNNHANNDEFENSNKNEVFKKEDLVYIDYKNEIMYPLGVSVKSEFVDFEKEKNIVKNLSEKLEEINDNSVETYIIDSKKLMVSTNGKILISEYVKKGKASDEIIDFYKPVGIDIVFKENKKEIK